MQVQAETICIVFSDPMNFHQQIVKILMTPCEHHD